MSRILVRLSALLALASPALAADLPTLPASAPADALSPDFWRGFYVGGGVGAFTAKGMKGAFGVDSFAGYDRVFANGVTLGMRFDAGYNPWLSPSGLARGYDFGEAQAKIGLQMGQITPYVFTGVALAKETAFAPAALNGGAAVNSLFADPGTLRAGALVGVGVDYQVNDRVKIGFSAYMRQSPAP